MNMILHLLKDYYELFRFIQLSKVNGICKVRLSSRIKGWKFISIKGSISLGENCKLLCWGEYTSSIKRQILSPILEIGKNFRATRNLTIQCAGHTYIGDDVLISSDVFVIDYNHCLDPRNDNYLDGNLDVKGVVIDDGAWIGNNVVILPGSKIGKKAVIGAGSVVSGAIEDYCVAVGNPARPIKRWNFETNKWDRINR